MNIFKIDAENHAKFLSEERHDPVTGENLVAGDEIVICAACQTAFLLETWHYIGKTHCNQSNTLAYIPQRNKDLRLYGVLDEQIKKIRDFKTITFENRASASSVDFAVVYCLMLIHPILGLLYWVLKDALNLSYGKHYVGLKIVETEEVKESSFLKKIVRNIFSSVPILIGVFQSSLLDLGIIETPWLNMDLFDGSIFTYFFSVIFVLYVGLEMLLVLNKEDRLIDTILGTKVVSKKEFEEKRLILEKYNAKEQHTLLEKETPSIE